MKELKIEYISIKDLKPYKRNAKQHPKEQIEQIKKSIEEFGMNDPLAVWKENEIIEGHGRLIACQELGIDTVPIIRLDDLTDEQRKAYMLVHNKLTMNTDFDLELLNSELSEITDINMEDFGFDLEEKKEENPEPHEDDYDVDMAQPEPVAKYGDIWKLGEHRLMCGDSTKAEDVGKLMDGELADLVVTDPPYNVAVGSKNAFLNTIQKAGRVTTDIAGDKGMTDEEIGKTLWLPAFERALENSKERCSIYVTMPQGGTHMMMMMMIARAGWQVKHELVWVKNSATFSVGRLDYDYQHEPILYGWNKSHAFYAKDYLTSIIGSLDKQDFGKMKKEDLVELCNRLFGDYPTSIIRENKPTKSDLHPTMKPITLIARLINNSSRAGELVLDLFGGSGSTMIACEQTKRRCNMMELDPHYCDVIIDRWEQFTGKKAEKLN